MQDSFQNKSSMDSKSVAVNIILIVNAFAWYLFFFSFLKNNAGFAGDVVVIIVGVNLLAFIVSAVLSSWLIRRIETRLKFIIRWMVVGLLLSPLALLVGHLSLFGVLCVSGIVGLYFGFGFPVLMGYCSATVESVNRAKVGGLSVFFYGVGFTLIALFVQSPVLAALALVFWKLWGLVVIVLLKPSEAVVNKSESISYKSVLKSRSVLLYFFPWLMFSVVNNFTFPILSATFDSVLVNYVTMVTSVLAGVFAIFFGFLADRFGRKRLLFLGFTLFGLGYAILSFFPTIQRGLYFYVIADSVAWGVFTTLFFFTVWGDLAGKRDGEKFFVIGFLPYMISTFLQVVFYQYVANASIALILVFPFAFFFLFITAIPLYLAPETLPERDLENRDLQSYLENAKKVVEKESTECKKRNQPEIDG